ncbi:hypothetical protein [Bailinhaonella thermotolerans]|uniref:Uncharacterized protein n=1 Tax=Bailinhaonella thermotolerans TaxID=1070861 RepID=A0A3A4ASU1_9ACTN|nr:hypothetical protein [Bailinhaonella thermotolerans]RJL31649.1 hypothetical protein D5H75_18220 [Bailinhaonella thermotolerans]
MERRRAFPAALIRALLAILLSSGLAGLAHRATEAAVQAGNGPAWDTSGEPADNAAGAPIRSAKHAGVLAHAVQTGAHASPAGLLTPSPRPAGPGRAHRAAPATGPDALPSVHVGATPGRSPPRAANP